MVFMLLAALALVGCSKKQDSSAVGTSSDSKKASANAAPPPNYVAATAQNAPTENVAGTVNPFLTEQLGIFIREKGRMPESFTELARSRLDSVPRPPEGMKWVIDAASKQVKSSPAQ